MAHHARASVLVLLTAHCVSTGCGGALADDSDGFSSGGELPTTSLGGKTYGKSSNRGGAATKSSSYARGGTNSTNDVAHSGKSSYALGGAASVGGSTAKGGTIAAGGSSKQVATSKGGTSARSGSSNLGGSSSLGGVSSRGGTTATGGSSNQASSTRGGSSAQGGSVSFGGSMGGVSTLGIAGTGWVPVGAPLAGAAGAPAEWLDATIYAARDLTPTDEPCDSGTSRFLAQLGSILIAVRQCTADADCTELGISTACGVICPMPVNRNASANLNPALGEIAQGVCSSCPPLSTPGCMSSFGPTVCLGGICRSRS